MAEEMLAGDGSHGRRRKQARQKMIAGKRSVTFSAE